MSKKPSTAAIPRYRIESAKGDFFDIFNKRANAIKAAIKLASEYPGATFIVVKKVNFKSKTIFSFKVEVTLDFDDIQDVYQGILEAYQEKLNKTRYWRKSDDT
jgi:hypothetical protein